MRNDNRENWQLNIEDTAARAGEAYGIEAVEAVFWRYGAHDFYDLDPDHYSEVFGELELLANDN